MSKPNGAATGRRRMKEPRVLTRVSKNGRVRLVVDKHKNPRNPKTDLTAKEEIFAAEYVANLAKGVKGAGKKARDIAGYSKKSSPTVMKSKPAVKLAIAQHVNRLLSHLDITNERILTEVARLAFLDPRKFFREDGSPIPIPELDSDAAAALAGMDVEDQYAGHGKDREWVGQILKYKLTPKTQALELLMRYRQLLKDEHGGPGLNVVPSVTVQFVSVEQERVRSDQEQKLLDGNADNTESERSASDVVRPYGSQFKTSSGL